MPLLTIRLPQDATLAAALQQLSLSESDVDVAYGLVTLDPAHGIYALRVTDAAATSLTTTNREGIGIFADPRIEPNTGTAGDSKPLA
jgi:hypothetical protein